MVTWFISKYASIPKYGAASRLFYLANEFNKNGQEAILITSDANHLCEFPNTNKFYNYEKVGNTPIYWIKTKKYKKTASLSRILSWVDFEIKLFFLNRKKIPKPDVVVVSSLSLLTIIYGFYLKKIYKARLVFDIRDIWPLTMTEEGGFSEWHPLVVLLGLIEKFGYRNSDLIVGTMPKLDLHINESIGCERPFFCSPIGYDEKYYHEILALRNEGLGKYFPKEKVIVGYAGSMGISNALEPFIECIKKIEHISGVHFILTGGGDLRLSFEEQLAGVSNVSFVPKILAKEVPEFLSRCDILYLSTQKSDVWRFGQSMNKVVEYMLSGKPIIASYSGYPSMLSESGAGVFIPSGDTQSIQEAIMSYVSITSEERHAIGAKGKEWILQNRSYLKLANDYIDQLTELMNETTS